MNSKVSGIVTAVISVIVLIAVNTFCKPCHGEMTMSCERSTSIACAVLAAMILADIAAFYVKKRAAELTISLIKIAGGIFLLFIPKLGRCPMTSMACNAKTFPAIRIGGLLIIATTVIVLVIGIIKGISRREIHAHT